MIQATRLKPLAKALSKDVGSLADMLNATHSMSTPKGAPDSWAAVVLSDLEWLARHAAPEGAPAPAADPRWWTGQARWANTT